MVARQLCTIARYESEQPESADNRRVLAVLRYLRA
jgi:hypothetical protein